MEIIKLRHLTLKKALLTLENGLQDIQAAESKKLRFHALMRDGAIQRFEYCIDSFWKFLKLYIETRNSIFIESPSPRTILRATLQAALINDTECKILLDALSERNLTSHTYNETLADTIYSHIPLYLTTMKTITERFSLQKN